MAKRVSFWATKKVPKQVNVTFRSKGKQVSFTARKATRKRVKISFFR